MIEWKPKNWIEPVQVEVPDELLQATGVSNFVGEFLVKRGIDQAETAFQFLDPSKYHPSAPDQIPGMVEAADRLISAIERRQLICVWGDFDVDGQAATALLYSALSELGGQVIYHVPDRETESHGVSRRILEEILDPSKISKKDPRRPRGNWGPADLILTCDTGISAHDAIQYARDCGVDAIITDHHQLPAVLPDAYAIVNPRLCGMGQPLSFLPGVGVAYKLVEQLYIHYDRVEEVDKYLDLVALGIVADVAMLAGDNRYLLQNGINVLRIGNRVGLKAIYEMAELSYANTNEDDIGFAIAPRLNALGRLGDASLGVELLTTSDISRATIIAQQIENLNNQRKLLTDQVFRGALSLIDQDPNILKRNVLVLSNPSWPAGVLGIVANKLVEKYDLPVVLLSTPPNELARASVRSLSGLDITRAIESCKHLLENFGGHPMAAGFSIRGENIEEFSETLSQVIGMVMTRQPLILQIDAYLELAEINQQIMQDLNMLAPFGPGNPAPIFVSKEVKIAAKNVIGQAKEHLVLTINDPSGGLHRVMWWQGGEYLEGLPQGYFDLAYTLKTNTYQGETQILIELLDYRVIPDGKTKVPKKPVIEVADFRQILDAEWVIQQLPLLYDCLIWAEGKTLPAETQNRFVTNRYQLRATQNLVIWNPPPGWIEMKAALDVASPERVFLFGVDPGFDKLVGFLQYLSGLVKHSWKYKAGLMDIRDIVVATAQSEILVGAGIEWLADQGHLSIIERRNFQYWLDLSTKSPPKNDIFVKDRLEKAFQESRAYQRYYMKGNLEGLFGTTYKVVDVTDKFQQVNS